VSSLTSTNGFAAQVNGVLVGLGTACDVLNEFGFEMRPEPPRGDDMRRDGSDELVSALWRSSSRCIRRSSVGVAVWPITNTLQRPTGQCSTVISPMGKSAGLPVAKRALMPAVAAAIRQSAW
jgi:hypothetical protein